MSSSGGRSFPPRTVMAFVDAGYLTAGARRALSLEESPRINGSKLFLWAHSAWTNQHGSELLRTYVYDAAYPAGSPNHESQRAYFDDLAASSGIRLRLGNLVERTGNRREPYWQQKGVDTLLVLDLVRLAQQRAFDIALVVAGDRDLAEALRLVADEYARRVVLYSVEGSTPSRDLVHAADDHGQISVAHLKFIFPESESE